MRAVVHDSYGPPDVLRIEEIESPVPHDDEILVEIHATTVTRTDTHLRAGEPSSAASSRVCGARGGKSAASSSRERSELSGKPSCTSRSATRSSASAGSLSLVCLGHADLHDGDRILVYGASGSIGSAVVQVANALGADVTGVCNTKRNGETYDVIFDAVGKQSFRRCKDSLAAGGP